jgi:hypothetical protein
LPCRKICRWDFVSDFRISHLCRFGSHYSETSLGLY